MNDFGKKSVTPYRKILRDMVVGEKKMFSRSQKNSIMATASLLKKRGEGTWYCSLAQYERYGCVTRIK